MTFLLLALLLAADDADSKYPLDPQMKVLAEDVKTATYRQLVLEKMLETDLAAEWQRVATIDNAQSFLDKYGGKDKVLADPDLKRAYERRVAIERDFLDLMREGFKKYKKVAPFDRGEKAERAGTTTRKPAVGAVTLSVVGPAPDAERHWPRFRGYSGQGATNATHLPDVWDKEGKNVIWRTAVPGQGNSSPVVWGDRLFVTSSSDKGAERFVHCFRVSDGKLLWSQAGPKRPQEPGVRDKNGFASATPATDGERVVAFLGSSGVVCFDFDGKQIWHHDLPAVKSTHGVGSSPLLWKNLVILAQDQNQSESIFLALDKKTGIPVWTAKRQRAMSWTSPVVVRVGDHDELIIAGAERVKGYDPATGKELWSLAGPTHEVVPTIVVGPDMIYCASGRNGPTLGLRPGGKGDVTETHLVWRAVRNGPHVPSPILVGNRLYTANDTGIVTCLDAATGNQIFYERIYDRFSASPVLAGDRLYFCAESGITYVLKVSDKYELIAKNDLGSPILASPAVVGERMILRTEAGLVCVGAKD